MDVFRKERKHDDDYDDSNDYKVGPWLSKQTKQTIQVMYNFIISRQDFCKQQVLFL